MKSYFCTKQKAVAAALREGRWQQAMELQTHAARCPSCADLVLVTQTLQQARRETMQALSQQADGPAATPVSSSALWWRAELRRRYGAVERMTTPIAFAERLALAGIPAALVGLMVWQWDQITSWLGWLAAPLNIFGSDPNAPLLQAAMSVLPLGVMVTLGGILMISALAWLFFTENE